jgi:MFS family permease
MLYTHAVNKFCCSTWIHNQQIFYGNTSNKRFLAVKAHVTKRNLFASLGISAKSFGIIFVLLFNSFIWFFLNLAIISAALGTGSTNQIFNVSSLIVWTTYLVAVIGSSISGAILSSRWSRLKLIYVWLVLGIITSFFLSASTMNISAGYGLAIIFFAGVAFGLGMPSTLAYFAEYTAFENRGQVGGVIFFMTNLGIAFAAIFFVSNLVIDSFATAIWRIIGLGVFFLLKPIEGNKTKGKTISFRKVLSDRTVLLFLIPWFMFCLIDRFEYQIFLQRYPALRELSLSVEPIVGTVFALIGGLFADWVGRKKVVLFGFVMLGLAYAVLGIAPGAAFSQYFNILIDGIAWGIFLVAFLLVLWGDLSANTGGHEKYYVVGSIPFFIAYLMQYLVQPYISSIPIGTFEVSFSFASLFLFIAVLPLIFAPETLPEKKIQERQLKKYVEEAKKAAAKGG